VLLDAIAVVACNHESLAEPAVDQLVEGEVASDERTSAPIAMVGTTLVGVDDALMQTREGGFHLAAMGSASQVAWVHVKAGVADDAESYLQSSRSRQTRR